MKKSIFFIVAILSRLVVFAGTDPLKIEFGPWVQNVTDTSVTILWKTTESTFSWVEFSKYDDKSWNQSTHPKYYQTANGRRMYGKYHKVTINGLSKATKYSYRIVGKPIVDDSNPYACVYGAERVATSVHTIKTLDPDAVKCKFSVVNDMHFRDDRYTTLMSSMDKENTDFIVLNGDIVSFSNSIDTLVKHTFQPIKEFCGDFPIFFARGNHETRGTDWYKLIDVLPTSTGEYYYTFRHGPAAFVVLDAGEDKPDSDPEYSGQAAFDEYRDVELKWLKNVVKRPEFANAPIKICIIHIPALGNDGAWWSQYWITKNFTPVLNDAGVDLMIGAHHHKYILSDQKEYGNDFTIFVNGSGERLDVEITEKSIELKDYDLNGKTNHSYTIKK